MLVITKNTEKVFLSALKECCQNSERPRCLFFKFSKLECRREDWVPSFFQALEKGMCSDDFARVYICYDQDVFVLMRGATQKGFKKILENFASELRFPVTEEMGNIFDLAVDSHKVERLCERKMSFLNNVKIEEKQKGESEKQKKKLQKTLAKIDPVLVSTLSVRKHTHKEPQILIVEDDKLSRVLVKNSLEYRFSPFFVQDGQNALVSFVETAPDVVFLDIGLPDMSGHEVLEQMLQIDPDAYIIMFSGKRDEKNILKALNLGAKGFIGKPFARKDLFQYIENAPYFDNRYR